MPISLPKVRKASWILLVFRAKKGRTIGAGFEQGGGFGINPLVIILPIQAARSAEELGDFSIHDDGKRFCESANDFGGFRFRSQAGRTGETGNLPKALLPPVTILHSMFASHCRIKELSIRSSWTTWRSAKLPPKQRENESFPSVLQGFGQLAEKLLDESFPTSSQYPFQCSREIRVLALH